MSIILFLVILAVLIFVHELGHFLVAKWSGIRVDEFSIGFPPRIISWKRGETLYSLNAIPFGGYVKIFGETPDEAESKGPDTSRSLVHKPRYIQAAVLVAGIVFNIIFAWILISVSLMTGYKMPVDNNLFKVENAHVTILAVAPDSPAEVAGVRMGDEVIKIQSGENVSLPTTVTEVQNIIAQSSGEVVLTLLQNGEEKIATTTPTQGIVSGDRRAIGVSLGTVGVVKLPPHKAIMEGAKLTYDSTVTTAQGLLGFFGGLFNGTSKVSDVSGPVGIAGMVGDASHFGLIYLLGFTAFISINLAVINLFPLPALDGGRLLFIIIESIVRRPIPYRFQNIVNAIGFALLLGLMLFVTYKDILKLWN